MLGKAGGSVTTFSKFVTGSGHSHLIIRLQQNIVALSEAGI
jgi:hypothetical protein